MSDTNPISKFKPIQLRYYALGIIVVWTSFIVLSLVWNFRTERSGTIEAAKIEARAAFEKDVLYRRWNASHGGLYAPVTEVTPPNPHLKVPERDIESPEGIKLTKINPAYMTRQVHEIAMKAIGVQGHITSLNPIRPENAPDEWEKNALNAFQEGAKEVSSRETIDGSEYLRLMRPLITEKGCLNCHAEQGYKLGDIRGGISVAVPLSPLIAIERSSFLTFTIIDGLLWLIGLVGIGLGTFFLTRQIQHRLWVEEELRRYEKIQGIVEMAGAVCHQLNQPLQSITGNSELLLMDMDKDDPHHKKITRIKQQADRMGEITKKLMGITQYKTADYPKGKILDIDEAAK